MLKVERDKVYVDGLDRKVRVVCVDAPNDNYPVIGCPEDGPIRMYTADGKNTIGYQSNYDLVREFREKRVYYLNVYPVEVCAHESKEKADELATLARVARIRVEYEEGQYDG